MAIIASIHQPPTNTFFLFDSILLLSEGRTVYFGPSTGATQYFTELGHPPEPFMSPAESILQLVNVDFARLQHERNHLDALTKACEESPQRKFVLDKNCLEPKQQKFYLLPCRHGFSYTEWL